MMAKLKISYPALVQPSRVVFGTGSLRTLRDCDRLGDTVFFISGQDQVRDSLSRVLEKAGCELTDANCVIKPLGEPTTEMIQVGSAFLEGKQPSRVVGIGGGSTLDWCRLAVAHAAGALDIETGRIDENSDLHDDSELWLIPTTCATGAEAAQVAVYSRDGAKLASISPTFIADNVVLDGRFLESISAENLACLVCDTLSHGIEAYCSIVPNHLAKQFAFSALRLVLENFDETPGSSRNDRLMEAGYLGGVAASNCSVGVVHAFAHSVAHLGISHSLGNALGLVAGLRANADTPAVQALAGKLGFDSVADLTSAIGKITSAALSVSTNAPLLRALRSNEGRANINERMQHDVCLRSNPQPLDEAAIRRFLDDVCESTAAA